MEGFHLDAEARNSVGGFWVLLGTLLFRGIKEE